MALLQTQTLMLRRRDIGLAAPALGGAAALRAAPSAAKEAQIAR